MNSLRVDKIDLYDPLEGKITFEIQDGKYIEAFFWGEKFEEQEKYLIEFSSIDYSLDWSVIFSENKEK